MIINFNPMFILVHRDEISKRKDVDRDVPKIILIICIITIYYTYHSNLFTILYCSSKL